MICEAEIVIRREDPRALMADLEAVTALLQQRKANRNDGARGRQNDRRLHLVAARTADA